MASLVNKLTIKVLIQSVRKFAGDRWATMVVIGLLAFGYLTEVPDWVQALIA